MRASWLVRRSVEKDAGGEVAPWHRVWGECGGCGEVCWGVGECMRCGG